MIIPGTWSSQSGTDPVSRGHALIIPRRHCATWFDATPEEIAELSSAVNLVRQVILEQHKPDGFNIGVNVGTAAGQTIDHLHVHLMPRYDGDVIDPHTRIIAGG
jgi:diadenosine tetraphosphate (Ap4A) HIT family hydrolase